MSAAAVAAVVSPAGRKAQTAANLVEQVLPAVPLRQWVFTLPFAFRSRVAYDGELLGAVGRLFADTLLGQR